MRTLILFNVLFSCLFAWAQPAMADDKDDLESLLDYFLAFDNSNALERHSRFWADDLIYTSSSGQRFGKQHIIDDLKSSSSSDQPTAMYYAEDTDIRVFGSTAVIAFTLVAKSNANGQPAIQRYFNTGTFVKRQGLWQAVAWQATKIPQ